MRKINVVLMLSLFSFSAACNDKKKVEEKEETASQPAVTTGTPKTGDALPPAVAVDNKVVPVAPKPSLELYPPSIGVFPFSLPDAKRSLYFGFAADGTRPFQMVFGYAVAAVPDFDQAITRPNFKTEAEFDTFMNDWAKQFQANAKYTQALNQLATSFAWVVDPVYFSDVALVLPDSIFAGAPEYVKATQKVFARRFTTKAVGNTTIKGTVDGGTLSIPVVIQAYTNAQMLAGKTRYETATTGCIGCHGNATTNQDAFLKHSSDYLAFVTDLEIMNLVKTSAYPDGSLLNNGTHKFTFATPADETALVAYLRSFPPSFDKIQAGVGAATFQGTLLR